MGQFYASTGAGDRANAHAVKVLSKIALSALTKAHKRTCPIDWVRKSLGAPGNKIWIHQGSWLRRARRADRHLLVVRWEKQCVSTDKKRREKAFWSALTPSGETDVEIMGGFITLSGTALGEHKPARSLDLHGLGFT